ncbi:hypothetical protein QFZ79_001096 [Arthrobacter sp. V4I6]|nr:hypothetical protein [Arthrobacter sp. V1I7]MDQ0852985.1 hypothetical protein [Arthrobacter sp. V4I6]
MTAAGSPDDTGPVSYAEGESTILKVVDRLAVRFPGAPKARIAEIVREEYDLLAAGRIRIYIPTLIENAARNRLHGEFDSVATLD